MSCYFASINGQQRTLSTMPAMPKEKASAISISESNFVDMKIKGQLESPTRKLDLPTLTLDSPTLKLDSSTLKLDSPTLTFDSPSLKLKSIYVSSKDISDTSRKTINSADIVSKNYSEQIYDSNNKHNNTKMASNNFRNDITTHSPTLKFDSPTLKFDSSTLKFDAATIQLASPTLKLDSPTLKPKSICLSSTDMSDTSSSSRKSITSVDAISKNHSEQIYHSNNKHNYTKIASNENNCVNDITSHSTVSCAVPSSNDNKHLVPSTPPKKSANDYVFGKYIGEGSFSTVYLAKDVHTNKECAIKVCDKQHIVREKKQEYVRREREVMHIMNNVPGFVHLACTFQDRRSLYFVMTYAKNGDLLPYINKVGSFDLDCTRHYAAELVLAMEYMHKRGIIHRDLKPENILLDENMHTLIADFGSAKILCPDKEPNKVKRETDGANAAPQNFKKRKGSFVGTAQYVSPEVLQGNIVTRSADLWALGCIIYQMISGLPPFRGGSDYLIFKEIMNLNLVFPEGFDENAEDLVRHLLKIDPEERIGCQDKLGRYESIRTQPFFEGINWDTIRQETPPPIYPYLPGNNKDEELRSHYRVPDNLEPGLDDRQLTRLLGLELGSVSGAELQNKTESQNNFDLNETEKNKLLEAQKSDKWNAFADGEVILKKGFVNKRKGLFARKRMLLLATGPRLIYIDPVQMIKKGEIPWSSELRVEPKNFKIFFVHTPNRTYYLEDPEGYALEWVNAIEDVRQKTYGNQS